METLLRRAVVGFPKWSQTPIPGVDISAAGLLALADLSTIAQRTRISGASWLDALLLAPGLHYQQAADAVLRQLPSPYNAVESMPGGKTSTFNVANTATLQYLARVGRPDQRVVVDVAMERPQRRYFPGREPNRSNSRGRGRSHSRRRRSRGRRGVIWRDREAGIGWISQVLYLASPLLTITAFVFMVLLQEWWGVAALLGLMWSRILNIWVIKQRSTWPKPPSPPPSGSDPDGDDRLTEYMVDLGHGRVVCLRGLASDLQAITTTSWLRDQTHFEGYLEAAAKLTVYLVASFSGNLSQAASIVFLALLLATAGLLGLSNAHAKALSMRGRLAAPTTEDLSMPMPQQPRHQLRHQPPMHPHPVNTFPPYPDSRQDSMASWPSSSPVTSSRFSAMDEYVSKN